MREMVGRGYELAGELGVNEVMLIGGAQLYKTLMPHCDRLYITDVDADIAGDAYFSEVSKDDWKLVSEERVIQGPKDDYPFTIRIYDRIAA